MVQKKDIYYLIAVIGTTIFFGVFIIPQLTHILFLYHTEIWLIILIVCILIPLFAITILWMVIHEIQEHFNKFELSDKEVEKIQLKAFSEEEEQFIEAKMREQLDTFQFKDEEILDVYTDLILTYLNNQIKKESSIPIEKISNMVEIPIEIVKDILLLLIADELINGIIEDNIFKYQT
ncbi:MAG: hypothetical protein ACTSRS_20540 [Candidatus Helarchaeota archaeon]